MKSGSKTTSARHGGMVRVWMDRPWFSSGDGELLGVVTAWNVSQAGSLKDNVMSVMARPFQQAPPGYVVAAQQPYVTLGTGPGVALGVHDVRSDIQSLPAWPPLLEASPPPIRSCWRYGGLRLPSRAMPSTSTATKAMAPQGRQLWYSDIQMTLRRLLLSRSCAWRSFATSSTRSTARSVSRLVMADFVQLAPDRVATVTSGIDADDQRKIGVTVVGVGPTNPANGHLKNEFVVTVETQQPNVKGDVAWLPSRTGPTR